MHPTIDPASVVRAAIKANMATAHIKPTMTVRASQVSTGRGKNM